MHLFSGGYHGQILRVDLSQQTYTRQTISASIIKNLLGGRGLAAWLYYNEISPEVDALGPENKVFFMTGPLTGVRLPSTTKFQLATKGPETRMYQDGTG